MALACRTSVNDSDLRNVEPPGQALSTRQPNPTFRAIASIEQNFGPHQVRINFQSDV